MVNVIDALVRPALGRDEQQIANLLHFEPYVHRHLDWRAPLDWLGNPYYWVLEHNGRVSAALACPPDPKHVHWLRLFACASTIDIKEAWDVLWNTALQDLAAPGQVAVISLHDWMRPFLLESGFIHTQNIVMLEWNDRRLPEQTTLEGIVLRRMLAEDLPRVAVVDAVAFAPLWCNSLSGLEKAFSQAGYATVAEEAGRMIGYQITTQNPFSAHLARLAVLPDSKRRGVGHALVRDLIVAMRERSLNRITVNTQGDNKASLALYAKLGFYHTRESYPVYVFEL